MEGIVLALYLLAIAALLLSDIAKGLLDVVLEQPTLRQAHQLIHGWFRERLIKEVAELKARQKSNFENCSWERCDAVLSGAGKAIVMK